ncbi:glycosyltransferase family 2 protein, partial [Xanthomonas perforans]|nr:glycosyltransferase family 2 protein [Xanthomonas perforans]
MTPVQIAAVVVTYESSSTIDACLSRLRAAEGISEIRVVDNASSDDTLEVVQRHALADARLHFIANPDNPGFATACNQGARDSQAPWLVFINPDLMVARDTLLQLYDRAAGHPAVLLGVEQVDEQGRPDAAVRRRDPDFAAMLRAPRAAANLAVPADPSRALQPVDAISGALMLMQRSLF